MRVGSSNENHGWNELKKNVIEQDLCTLCGTCIGICPVSTLAFDSSKETIYDLKQSCINCGQCMKSCPGAFFDYKEMNEYLYGASLNDINLDIGYYSEILRGHSLRKAVQEGCASGGIATELGIYMLEHNLVDYVIGICGEYPNYSVAAISNVQDLYQTMQSKYIFIPTNEIIEFILHHDGKYLYIGLPCQIQGLKKACMVNQILSDRIKLCVGIFCGFNMARSATEFLIDKSNIKREEIKKIQYRAKKGTDTGFQITGSNSNFFIPKHGYTVLNAFYTRKRCWKCYDLTGEFSDISLGDAWEKKQGWSRIIVRTEQGRKLLDSMIEDGKIVCENSSLDDIYITQKKIISYKKRAIFTRKIFIKNFPYNNIPLKKVPFFIHFKACIFLFIMEIGQTNLFRSLLRLCPIKLLTTISATLRNSNN